MSKTVKIPKNINLQDLLEKVEGNKTYKQSIKDSLIYFLSLILLDDEYYKKSPYMFRRINSQHLDNIIGNGFRRPTRAATIKKLLVENDIIEINNYKVGERSTSYRFTKKYLIRDFIEVELSEKILINLEKYKNHYESKVIKED